MPLTETQRVGLLDGLQKIGWSNEGDFIYAPNRSMWLSILSPWTGESPDFLERMAARVGRIYSNKEIYASAIEHQKVMDDTAGLVEVLRCISGRSS